MVDFLASRSMVKVLFLTDTRFGSILLPFVGEDGFFFGLEACGLPNRESVGLPNARAVGDGVVGGGRG